MSEQSQAAKPLEGKVALVAGATRGAGRAIAVELAQAGAYVYATGRSSRVTGPSEIERHETIEETGELMASGTALRVDHLEPAEVQALVDRIAAEQGRLDIWSTTSSAATATPSGTSRSGSTTSPVACACCGWASTPT